MLRPKKFFIENEFTVEVEVTPYCNFSCEYCENKHSLSYNSYDEFNIDFNLLLAFIKKLTIQHKKITLLLNGGEPTCHPSLLYFCKQLSQLTSIKTILYTNMSASADLYHQLQEHNVIIIPTYHSDLVFNTFEDKLKSLNISSFLLPASDDIDLCLSISTALSYNIVLLENKCYSSDKIKQLSKYDKFVVDQYKLQTISHHKNMHICNCNKYYLYVNGNGDICNCMFSSNSIVGNIKDYNFKFNPRPIVCNNEFCFYQL